MRVSLVRLTFVPLQARAYLVSDWFSMVLWCDSSKPNRTGLHWCISWWIHRASFSMLWCMSQATHTGYRPSNVVVLHAMWRHDVSVQVLSGLKPDVNCCPTSHWSVLLLFPEFPTRMVCLYYISCLRYTILVGNPRFALVSKVTTYVQVTKENCFAKNRLNVVQIFSKLKMTAKMDMEIQSQDWEPDTVNFSPTSTDWKSLTQMNAHVAQVLMRSADQIRFDYPHHT